jgi:hypothetical protein
LTTRVRFYQVNQLAGEEESISRIDREVDSMYRRQALTLVTVTPLVTGCSGLDWMRASDASILRKRKHPSPAELPTAQRPRAQQPPDATAETVAPLPYPEKPASYTEKTATSFIKQYERAYRRNRLLKEDGGQLVAQGFTFDFTMIVDCSDSACVGRTQYQFTATRENGDSLIVEDSEMILVAYYVSDSMVVRAEADRPHTQTGVLFPDPWKTGTILIPAEGG